MFFPAGRRAGFNTATLGVSGPRILLVAGPQFAQVTNSGSAATINFSPPPEAGDVVYVWQTRQPGGGGPALSTGGYTELGYQVSINIATRVWRKVMGSTPNTAVTTTVNDSRYGLVIGSIILRGVDNAIPEDVPVTVQLDETPAITTATANTMILALYSTIKTGPVNVTASPAGYSNFATLSGGVNTVGNALALAGSMKLLAVPGVEDPGPYTHDGTAGIGHTVAVRRG